MDVRQVPFSIPKTKCEMMKFRTERWDKPSQRNYAAVAEPALTTTTSTSTNYKNNHKNCVGKQNKCCVCTSVNRMSSHKNHCLLE